MISLAIDKTKWKKGERERKRIAANVPRHSESLAIETRLVLLLDPAESVRQKINFRSLAFARDGKKIPVPCSSLRSTDADPCHRCTFLHLDTVTLRVSARFHVSPVISLSHLRLRRPPHSPSFLVLSFFFSTPAFSSFLLLRFFLFHLQLLHLPPAETTRSRAAVLVPLPLILPTPLPLIPHDQTTTTATNNHLVPLRCRERRCCCACRLIFGRTFRFGVLYWTVQKWHLPVSELTSCQVSVSFARAVPGRWRVYASA